MKKQLILSLIAAPVLLFSSCKKKDDTSGADNTYVNNWIYESMNYWYYWNTNMPQNPNRSTDPETFFYSLLKKPDDRFSWIESDYQQLLGELSGVSKEAGYDFSLFLYGGNKLGGQILYVKRALLPKLPASNAVIISLKSTTARLLTLRRQSLTQWWPCCPKITR
ncbi:hypothetical protein MKQ70_28035 [Chitinophaga sedimenti]|uniref:hypothetical protein n=1 Tax=Chitinophaga sedimenti TaxID=2033606 RepID=UPI002005BC03|nr:hypothetical protein [Chitinophaga sedimenti]MCK7558638.1 hypothetical protein [Chitinophaga sedimenti]